MKRHFIPIICALLLGCVIGSAITYYYVSSSAQAQERKNFSHVLPMRALSTSPSPGAQFTNPLLACDLPESSEFSEYTSLKKSINDLTDSEIAMGHAKNISVYIKELTGGRWVGIDENHQYDPASLLKVVIMIAYYKEAEQDETVLSRRLQYTPNIKILNDELEFSSTTTLTTGNFYGVDDLIKDMIASSDNGAKDLLLANINVRVLDEVYSDLGIPNPDHAATAYTISTKNYSLFFRILYNATYLNRTYSEQALALLAKADFSKGIVGGLPRNTVIAHKFGEHVNGTGSSATDIELHDCGIVYFPGHPYFLCVMTSGAQLSDLEKVIQDVSSQVYQSFAVSNPL